MHSGRINCKQNNQVRRFASLHETSRSITTTPLWKASLSQEYHPTPQHLLGLLMVTCTHLNTWVERNSTEWSFNTRETTHLTTDFPIENPKTNHLTTVPLSLSYIIRKDGLQHQQEYLSFNCNDANGWWGQYEKCPSDGSKTQIFLTWPTDEGEAQFLL